MGSIVKNIYLVVIFSLLGAGIWFLSTTMGLTWPFHVTGAGVAFLLMLKAICDEDFFKNIRIKVPVAMVIGMIIWIVSGKYNFPIWWQAEFVTFVGVALIFFVILDLRELEPEKTAGNWIVRLLATYALASGLFITVTAQLPQFDPQEEVRKLNKPPLKLSGLAGPEVIAAGREVFEENKCFNCHKVFWEGNSDRGPNLGTKQIGLYFEDYIKEQILDPRKDQAPGFEDKKSKKAMPTYYGEDLSKDELHALVSYLKTLRDPTHMPVEGKFGNQWTWWDDPDVIAHGKEVFEGTESITADMGMNCSVCHGKDGTPMMTGALDFRDGNKHDTDKMPDQLKGVPMKDWPDDLWYKRVTRGVDETPMAPWGMLIPHIYLWKAEAYARTFHDPLDKRTEKKPVPPVPTKEEIESWKTDGLFLDPLL